MNKVYAGVEQALAGIGDGCVIAVGGFFTAGVPRKLLEALAAKKVGSLTLACGSGPLVGAKEAAQALIANRQIRKIIDSYPLMRSPSSGLNDPLEQAVRSNEIELEIFPMGTLAEKYRAAGAGIAAFYTPSGAGTLVGTRAISNSPNDLRPKETRRFNGEEFVLEFALACDFAFIHAYKGDREGNLQYRKTARNFNPVMAAAARVTIAEVENLVEPGQIDPEAIHTPGIYVKRVVEVPRTFHSVTMD
jgi:3-oxoacid CoA-transferase subunit A